MTAWQGGAQPALVFLPGITYFEDRIGGPGLTQMARRMLIFLCCLAGVLPLLAQPAQYRFAQLSSKDGLSHNQVNCFFKDHRGFMWFGTMSGLNRYDGYQFRTYIHNAMDSTSIQDDYIAAIWEGPERNLWIETRQGISVFNPRTEKFHNKSYELLARMQLPTFGLKGILPLGNAYWFYFADGLFAQVRPGKPPRQFRVSVPVSGATPKPALTKVLADSKGNLWAVFESGAFCRVDSSTGAVSQWRTDIHQAHNLRSGYCSFYVDHDDELWIFASGRFPGVYYFKPTINQLTHLSTAAAQGRLSNNVVNGVVQDEQARIWIATDHGGVNLLDKQTMGTVVLRNNPDNDQSIAQNSLSSIFEDDLGMLWLGTYKHGISYYRESQIKFPLVRHEPSNPASLGFDDINKFAEDRKGNIWIGTNGGGLIYFDRAAQRFTPYVHQPGNPNSLAADVVVSLCVDRKDRLWIGTYYGGLNCFDGKRFTHYRHNDKDTNSLSDNSVWEIFEDKGGQLWVGTLEGGLERFDEATGRFIHHRSDMPGSIRSNYISSIVEDRHRNLWIATSNGIDIRNPADGRFTHLDMASSGLSNDNVISLYADSRGLIWAGTRDGLNLYDPRQKRFQVFRTTEGLPSNTILEILEDDEANIWVSTPGGLSAITPAGSFHTGYTIRCKNYDEADGLQGKQFNENAAMRTRSGELMFGGANGFNLFKPSQIRLNRHIPSIVFTGFHLFNQPLEAGKETDGHVVLPQAITETREINLKHRENIFSIEFAALNYENNHKAQYAYQLEGFNKTWLYTDGRQRKITYTNLDPGTYVFRVKASNDDGIWNEEGNSLTIHIHPPFWKTPLAYLCYLVFAVGLLLLGRHLVIRSTRQKFAIEEERRQSQRLHELDLMKIKFFTNVSHEFKTPLSLILTPAEKLEAEAKDPVQRRQFGMIHRNARRLLHMVNQLLDFRKMEEQEMHIHPAPGDFVRFVRELSLAFNDMSEKKAIRFSVDTDPDSLPALFDHEKIERILFNLLSNAFKFTPAHGTVSVTLRTHPGSTDNQALVEIKVADSGVGISPEAKEKVFGLFFQQDNHGHLVNQGSGLGLYITREFVDLLGGHIDLESEEGAGSCFTVLLPIELVDVEPGHVQAASNDRAGNISRPSMPAVETGVEDLPQQAVSALTPLPQQDTPALASVPEQDAPALTSLPEMDTPAQASLPEQSPAASPRQTPLTPAGKRKIILVEDNDDFREYLRESLESVYDVLEAADGKAGWQKTLSAHPDLVVSDVNMPVMNGIDLCRKIRQDPRTARIPVILLTAATDDALQIDGLNTGASDYLTKPFNMEILQSRIHNILEQQETLRREYSRQVETRVSALELPSAAEKFMAEALQVVAKNVSNAEFSVEELSRAMCMSRVALYKKLFTLSGRTPIEFIRKVRLEHAAQLLEKTDKTIAEIAYESGFNNPKYFSRYFKEQYHMLPSAYQAAAKEKSPTSTQESLP